MGGITMYVCFIPAGVHGLEDDAPWPYMEGSPGVEMGKQRSDP